MVVVVSKVVITVVVLGVGVGSGSGVGRSRWWWWWWWRRIIPAIHPPSINLFVNHCRVFFLVSSFHSLIVGLGPEAEEDEPQENGSLDLEGRECLACSISSPPPSPQEGNASSEGGGGGWGGGGQGMRKRGGSGGGTGGKVSAAAAAAAAGRRGRSELYLVLDAKAFLLATPDRCGLRGMFPLVVLVEF